MKNLVIFASGSGTNAENIFQFFKDSTEVRIALILSNKKDAKVLERATSHGIPAMYFNKAAFSGNSPVLQLLQQIKPELIILAGFLWKMPESIVNAFPNKIINIHPALLPKYGGKGMYGMNVHNSVVTNRETETGITIHYVNEHYDEGAIIFQASVPVKDNDSAETVAKNVHVLEYEHFPKIIEKLLNE